MFQVGRSVAGTLMMIYLSIILSIYFSSSERKKHGWDKDEEESPKKKEKALIKNMKKLID
jgi:hypothetical protein